MTDYIGTPPAQRIIPVTRGADRLFSIRRRDEQGDPQDWDATLFIDIDIDKAAPTRVNAEVTDDVAVIRIESTLCDQVRNSTRWRILMSQPDTPTLETPLLVGTFERHDG